MKGRDWYDFVWYISKKTTVEFKLLQNALRQQGPWQNKTIKVDINWYIRNMNNRIKQIDWKAAKDDVMRFIPTQSQSQLEHWKKDFFIYQLNQMKKYVNH